MKLTYLIFLFFAIIKQTVIAQVSLLDNLPTPKSVTIDQALTKGESLELIQTARLFYAFWNTGKEEYVRESVSENFIDNTLPAGRPQGLSGLLVASKKIRLAVPDLVCTIDDMLIVRDKITARLTFTGHNTGSMNGHKPSGNAISFLAIDILLIKDGKISEDWHIEDNLTFFRQIGIVQ
ncbi:MAG: ester cyclase [Rhizobacter sp.]|nr:ester cyclase [Ferruginibacter sp.]